ncbi:alpha/beta hydrolase [Bacillus sp. es.034]|uniref:alpha/beta fold hydrolase n=1 Tax=Bacillus sp. es.034 TaxID=1761763 RepID=UPI000BF970D0|nr:alpha/beta hydrolase [Bacillus sp. es.034]PFG07536.1 proline iminopeptidase [Bacillus sp. es.034]
MEEKHVMINGKNVFITKKGAGAPIVFLHGGPGGSSDYFLPHMEPLGESFQIIFYDQTGCGRSEVEEGHSYSVDDEVNNLEEIRKALNLEKMTLFGESWGSILALSYAAKHPDRIDKLVLTATVGLTSKHYRAFKENLLRKLGFYKKMLLGYYSLSSLLGVDSSRKLEQLLDPHYVYSVDILKKKTTISYNQDALKHIGKELDHHYNLIPSLPVLQPLPIMIAQGSQDILSPDYIKENVLVHLNNAILYEVEESGHWTILEQPEKMIAITHEFMSSKGTVTPVHS